MDIKPKRAHKTKIRCCGKFKQHIWRMGLCMNCGISKKEAKGK